MEAVTENPQKVPAGVIPDYENDPPERWSRRQDVLSPRPPHADTWPTLKQARLDAGYTQQGLAEAAKVSIASVRDLERGVRTRVGRRMWTSLTRVLKVEGFRDRWRLENR